MLPLLLSVPGAPLVKTPNAPPEIDPPELFVIAAATRRDRHPPRWHWPH